MTFFVTTSAAGAETAAPDRRPRHKTSNCRIAFINTSVEWTYTGEIFDAREAHASGLVQKVVDPEDLMEEALRVAHRFTNQRSGVGIALTRQMMHRNAALPHPLEAHRIDSLAVFYLSQGDGKEGVRAFLEKREARFTSRPSTDIAAPLKNGWICNRNGPDHECGRSWVTFSMCRVLRLQAIP